ncbi:hypothetical protein [Labrenzia sp. OB1]|uniref:hypothetical protein n=1 Tax=Labrenzia sp. OB1 TaxID=1561204 RepID=UPI0018FE7EB0|nr:hypothetical protein [Labrenzia sp. OB1]
MSEGTSVIKARDFDTLGDAQSVVLAAKSKARQIIEDAEKTYEREKERGYQDGRDLAEKEALGRLLSEQSYLDGKLKDLETDLAKLVKFLVRKVIAGFDDTAIIESVTASALQKMRRENSVQIHLPTSLVEGFEPIVGRLKEAFPSIQTVEIVEDSDLAPPNLIVESRTGRVECNLALELDALDTVINETLIRLSSRPESAHQDSETVA